jgi:hypothetical protein
MAGIAETPWLHHPYVIFAVDTHIVANPLGFATHNIRLSRSALQEMNDFSVSRDAAPSGM